MIKNLQVLRAVAATMVVTYHIQQSAGRAGHVAYSTGYGAFGVDIFFVISGFIMFHTTAGFKRGPGEFLMDRVIRIIPLYWIATGALVGLFLAGFKPSGLHATNAIDVATSLLLIPRMLVADRQPVVLTLGWTLIFEFFFYGVFAATFVARSHRFSLAVMTVVFAALITLRELAHPSLFSIAFFLNSIVFEFLYGCVLAMVLSRVTIQPSWTVALPAAILLLGGFLALGKIPAGSLTNGLDPHARAVMAGLPALVIVACALVLERSGYVCSWRPAVLLGSASYSLYLFHPLILQPTAMIARHMIPLDGWPMIVAVTVLAACVAAGLAIVIHVTVERPLTRWLRRRLTKPLARGEPLADPPSSGCGGSPGLSLR